MHPKTKARLYVLFIFLACAAPVALSLFTYYVWKPEKRMNYGELLTASPISCVNLKTTTGEPFDEKAVKGKWVLLLVDDFNCTAACGKRLYAMRQSVLAMEIKKEKLAQVWMTAPVGNPDGDLTAQYPRTVLLASDAEWLQKLPQPSVGRILLIDPNGVPVLRYPEMPEPARMMKDLGRLLDVKRM